MNRGASRRSAAAYVAAVISNGAAAVKAGASQTVGGCSFGRRAVCGQRSSGARQNVCRAGACSSAECEEIALLSVQGYGVCEVARQRGPAASTISPEIQRNADARSEKFEYCATMAQWHAARAARRPRLVCVQPATRHAARSRTD